MDGHVNKTAMRTCLLAVILISGSCSTPDELLSRSGLIVLEGATLIDGGGGPPIPNSVVVVDRDRILRVGKVGDFRYPEDANVHDLRTRYLLPGFVDLHVHPRLGAERQTLQMLLAFGITTIRIPGVGFESHDSLGVELRAGVEDGSLTGPRIFTGAKIVEGPRKTFPDDVEVATEEELRAEVRRQGELGVDLVKLYWNTPPSFISAAVEEAESLEIQVVGHLRASSWTEAARLGIDGLVHCGLNGPTWELVAPEEREALQSLPFPAYYDRLLELIELDGERFSSLTSALVENGVTVEPTLAMHQALYYGDDLSVLELLEPSLAPESVLATWGEGWADANPNTVNSREAQTQGKGMFELCKEVVRRFHEQGVRLAAGTDVGEPWITPGVSFHRELQLLVEAGIPKLDVLRIATSNGARAIEQGAAFGTIGAGQFADFVVLRDNPLEDIRNTRSLEAIFKEGRRFDPATLMSVLD